MRPSIFHSLSAYLQRYYSAIEKWDLELQYLCEVILSIAEVVVVLREVVSQLLDEAVVAHDQDVDSCVRSVVVFYFPKQILMSG